jgi:hypothetical protein
MHELGEEHATEVSTLAVAPAGFGAVSIAQLAPFHRSINSEVFGE